MKKIFIIWIIFSAAVIILPGCEALTHDFPILLGEWELSAVTWNHDVYTNGAIVSNYTTQETNYNRSNQTTVIRFSLEGICEYTEYTNNAVKNTETVTWVADQIKKYLVIYRANGTNERLEYAISSDSNSIAISSYEYQLTNTNINVFDEWSYSLIADVTNTPTDMTFFRTTN